MKILVIGGTGHIGQHLVPMLLECGYETAVTTRGNRSMPDTFKNVRHINCDCGKYECLKALAESESFDVVIDFPGMAGNAWRCFRNTARHIVVCGSLWMFGNPKVVPTPEVTQCKCEFEGYDIRYQRILQILSEEADYNAAFTAIMPSNICGPGKIPLDTMGGRSVEVHRSNMRGESVYLPDGAEALISPCDASDLAQLFLLAINNCDEAAGQIFNGGSGYAFTASEFVNTMAEIYEVNIPIEYVSWERYREINPDKGAWWHFYSHMCPDISKAKKLLGYAPKFKPEETLSRAVAWMKENNML